MVNWLNFKDPVDQNCEGCAMGKQHGQPFPKKAKIITTGLLDLIHGHVRRPMDVPSGGGSTSFVTVIDNFSYHLIKYNDINRSNKSAS